MNPPHTYTFLSPFVILHHAMERFFLPSPWVNSAKWYMPNTPSIKKLEKPNSINNTIFILIYLCGLQIKTLKPIHVPVFLAFHFRLAFHLAAAPTETSNISL